MTHARSLTIIGLTLWSVGCAPLMQSSALFQHTPLLPEGTIPLTVQLRPLVDQRPAKERAALKTIPDLADHVTSVLLHDFQNAQLFTTLTMGETNEPADLVLRGTIRSFTVRIQDYYYEYTPLIFLVFFGVPEGRSWGQVSLTLEAIHPRTGTVLATYTADQQHPQVVTVYNEQAWRLHYGDIPGEAFRAALEQLKRAMLADGPQLQAQLAAWKANAALPPPTQEH